MNVNTERVAALVAALRSGQYEQGHNRLKDEYGGYCCLGVACDISGQGRWTTVEGLPAYIDEDGERQGLNLTERVREWYGFNSISPDVTTPGYVSERENFEPGERVLLEALNDNGYTFAEIADAIEAEYLTTVTA